MEKASINTVVRRLQQLDMVQAIFTIPNFKPDEIKKELLIVVSSSKENQLTEHYPLINLLFSGCEDIGYRLVSYRTFKKQLKEGNLFYHLIFNRDNLLFLCPSVNIEYLEYLVTDVIGTAKTRFEIGLSKIYGFRETECFCAGIVDYSLAAFMLHQQLEHTYRFAEVLLTGKEYVSHSILSHQRFISAYYPPLGNIFDPDDPVDLKLVRWIDKSYIEARYSTTYAIKKEKLEIAERKGLEAINLLIDCFQSLKSAYRNSLNKTV